MLSEAGIKFEKHASKGIDPQFFSEYLMASGMLFSFNFSRGKVPILLMELLKSFFLFLI